MLVPNKFIKRSQDSGPNKPFIKTKSPNAYTSSNTGGLLVPGSHDLDLTEGKSPIEIALARKRAKLAADKFGPNEENK